MATANGFFDSDVVIGKLSVLLSMRVVCSPKATVISLVLLDSRQMLRSKMVAILKTCR